MHPELFMLLYLNSPWFCLCTVVPVGSTEALDSSGVGQASRMCWGTGWGTGKGIDQPGSWCEWWIRKKPHPADSELELGAKHQCHGPLRPASVEGKEDSHLWSSVLGALTYPTHCILITLRTPRRRSYVTLPSPTAGKRGSQESSPGLESLPRPIPGFHTDRRKL